MSEDTIGSVTDLHYVSVENLFDEYDCRDLKKITTQIYMLDRKIREAFDIKEMKERELKYHRKIYRDLEIELKEYSNMRMPKAVFNSFKKKNTNDKKLVNNKINRVIIFLEKMDTRIIGFKNKMEEKRDIYEACTLRARLKVRSRFR